MARPDWRTSFYLRAGLPLWNWRPFFLYGAWKHRELYKDLIKDYVATDSIAVDNLAREVADSKLHLVGLTATNVYRRDEFGTVSRLLARRLAGAADAVDTIQSFFSRAPSRFYEAMTVRQFVLQRGVEDPLGVYGWGDLPWGTEGAYVQLRDLAPGFASVHVTYVPSPWLEAIASAAVTEVPSNNSVWHVTRSNFSLSHPSGAVGSAVRARIEPHIRRLALDGLLPVGHGLIRREMFPAGLVVYWSGDFKQPERSRICKEVMGVSAYDFWACAERYLFEEVVPLTGIEAGNLTWLLTPAPANNGGPSVPERLLAAQLPLLPWLAVWRGLQQIRLEQHEVHAAFASLSWRWPGSIRKWRLWGVTRKLLVLRFRIAEMETLVKGAQRNQSFSSGAALLFAEMNRGGIGKLPGEPMDVRSYLKGVTSAATELAGAARSDLEISTAAASELLSIRVAAIMQVLTFATAAVSILALVVAIFSVWLAASMKHS